MKEEDDELKEVKFNPGDYEWSLSNGKPKDVLKIYAKMMGDFHHV